MEYGGLQKLTTKEKVGFFAFLIFACAIVIFGFRGIGNAIKNPFAKSFAPPTPTAEELKQKQLAELKTKDTDKDGLSDYDELYVYNTSPYLADTDGDGISDKDEILKGTDPNCPKGTTCQGLSGAFAQGSQNGSLATPPIQVPTAGQIFSQASSTLHAPTAADQIRAMLRAQGVSEEQLQKIDDAALLNAYQEVLNPSAGATSTKQ